MLALFASLAIAAQPPVCRPGTETIGVTYEAVSATWKPSSTDLDRVVGLIEASGLVEITVRAQDSNNIGLWAVEDALSRRTKRPLTLVIRSTPSRPSYSPGKAPPAVVDVELTCP